jgi:hypothetical protein
MINRMTDDTPRPAAASRDDYSLTIMDVAARYEAAGFPRTISHPATILCQGHLDAIRQETPFGDQFLITPASVARHLAQIAEFAAAVTGRKHVFPAGESMAKPAELATARLDEKV